MKQKVRRCVVALVPEKPLFFLYRLIRRNRRLFLKFMLQANMLEKDSDG